MKKFGFLILFTLFFSACNKPVAHPELKDPIFNDLQTRLKEVGAELTAEQKILKGHQTTLNEVEPQTGQIKYARKRLYESQAKINRLEQEKTYLSLKINDRRAEARKSYLKAFEEGQDWPDMTEYEAYKAAIRLRQAKRTWDVQERIKELKLSEPTVTEPAERE